MELEIVFGGCLGIGWMSFGVWGLSVRGWWLDVWGRGVPGLRVPGVSRLLAMVCGPVGAR